MGGAQSSQLDRIPSISIGESSSGASPAYPRGFSNARRVNGSSCSRSKSGCGLTTSAMRYARDSELTNATQLARVVARLTPTDERMVRRVMTMLDRLDDRAGAIDVYAKFTKRLKKELDIEPSAETVRLADRIRSRSTRL